MWRSPQEAAASASSSGYSRCSSGGPAAGEKAGRGKPVQHSRTVGPWRQAETDAECRAARGPARSSLDSRNAATSPPLSDHTQAAFVAKSYPSSTDRREFWEMESTLVNCVQVRPLQFSLMLNSGNCGPYHHLITLCFVMYTDLSASYFLSQRKAF